MALVIKKTGTKTAATGKAVIQKQQKDGPDVVAESSEDLTVAPPVTTAQTLDGTPCVVGFEASFTKNLGNYQSMKIGVHLSIPCTHDEIDTVYTYAKDWVDTRLGDEVSALD